MGKVGGKQKREDREKERERERERERIERVCKRDRHRWRVG